MKRPSAMLETRGAVVLDDFVADLSWAPDGGRLAVAGGEGKVFLVTRPVGSSTGAASRALQAREVGEHLLGALSVAWQPRGENFVSCGQDGALMLHDGVAGRQLALQRPRALGLTSIAWAPDGRCLATASGRQLNLWTSTLELAHALPPLEAGIAAIGWDREQRRADDLDD